MKKFLIISVVAGLSVFLHASIPGTRPDIVSFSAKTAAASKNKIPGSVSIKVKKEPKDKLLKALKKYYPTGYSIIASLDNYPEEIELGDSKISISGGGSYKDYVEGGKLSEQIESLPTVVHEMNHAFTGRYGYLILQKTGGYDGDRTYYTFCIDENEAVLVDFGKTFPCKKLKDVIPAALRTSRFETYIYPADEYMSTQQDGVFGLLDEYNAYYHDAMTVYSLFDFYHDEMKQDDATWTTYVGLCAGTYLAYAEFRYWILTYMIYAKDKQSAIYKDIIGNKLFRQVFTKIDARFTGLMTAIDKRLENVAEILNDMGYEAEYADGNFSIGGAAMGFERDSFDMLLKEMQKPAYKKMLTELNKI
ncbi:MAG: hypothetical protein A2Y33_02450 [Spirochaetes bacterium GWF1_51_8]|nr:MAG: hypothetical protein A2Y33_02450 [Spirochaetes bacterium GWF1_51_8]